RSRPLDRKGSGEGETADLLRVGAEQRERDRAALLPILALEEPLEQRLLVRHTALEDEVGVLEPAAQLVLEAVLASFRVGLHVPLDRKAAALGEPADLHVVEIDLEAQLADRIGSLARRRRASCARLLVRAGDKAFGPRDARSELPFDSDRQGWQRWHARS